MLFRQIFDSVSCTYTYLMAARPGGEALIIDPVADRVEHYLRLLDELGLTLVKALDTHVHADHVSALPRLRDETRCITVMGGAAKVARVSMRVDEGDRVEIEGLSLGVLYTPGHTDDSYCFTMDDRVFTGDTLLIRGSGRTDFQNGDPRAAYESIFSKLLTLPDDTLVYPGHDYKGDTVSTIGEEKAHNPRLRVKSAAEYAAVMAALNLPDPKMMDVAVPANLAIGADGGAAGEVRAIGAEDALGRVGDGNTLFIDLREETERQRDGVIPGSVHIPYPRLAETLRPGGLLRAVARPDGPELLLYCAFGERSALAFKALEDAGLGNAWNLDGGIDAWKKAEGPLEPAPGRPAQG